MKMIKSCPCGSFSVGSRQSIIERNDKRSGAGTRHSVRIPDRSRSRRSSVRSSAAQKEALDGFSGRLFLKGESEKRIEQGSRLAYNMVSTQVNRMKEVI